MDSEKNKLFSESISKLQTTRELVGLGAIVLNDGITQGLAVSGERVSGSGVALAVDDKWHIGSITKSFTATLIGRLVEDKKLSWDASIDEVLQLSALFHDDWKKVTIIDLLTHTSGVPPNFPLLVAFQKPNVGSERITARRNAIVKLLRKPPRHSCGSKHIYSNVGYTILGSIVEELTESTWEDSVEHYVLEPLKLKSAGFGPPQDTGNSFEQPRGHRKRLLSSKRVEVGSDADNTPIIWPAGGLHMNLSDLAKFTNEHLRGDLGNGELLTSDSYNLLHTPALDDYACGWVVNPDNTVWHNGSNSMWYAFVAYRPRTKQVIAMTSNDPNIEECERVANEILTEAETFFE